MVWLREKDTGRDRDMAVIFCLLENPLFQVWLWSRGDFSDARHSNCPPLRPFLLFFNRPSYPVNCFHWVLLRVVRRGWQRCSWRGISKSRGWRTGGPHADSSLPVRSFNYHIISFYRHGAWRRAANEGGWSHAELRAFLNWCQQLKRGDECEVKWLRMWFHPRSSLLRSPLALILFFLLFF